MSKIIASQKCLYLFNISNESKDTDITNTWATLDTNPHYFLSKMVLL